METNDILRYRGFLRLPEISDQLSPQDLYRAACIGTVTLLFEEGDHKGLLDTVRHAPAPESRLRAMAALENLARFPGDVQEKAVHDLYELAVLDGNPEASSFLRKTDAQDRDPGWNSARQLLFEQKHQLMRDDPGAEQLTELFLAEGQALRQRLLTLGEKVIPNWCTLMRFLNDPSPENRTKLLDSFQSFSPDERKLLRFCIGKETKISSLPADILLRYDDEFVRELCVKNGLLPSDPAQQALFYFLSSQWEQYYASDSDYRRIRIAYEGKDPVLQRRLITVSRDSGNSAWLREVGGSSENMTHSGTLTDQHLFAASLIEQREWQRLWDALPNLPLLCMPNVVKVLHEAGFEPLRADEKEFFAELSEKIKACENLSPVPVRMRYGEGYGTAVGICGGGSYFAVLYADRKILVWDTRDELSAPIRITSNHLNFRRAVISHDGKYLCADCGRDGLTVFSLPGGQAVKTIAVGNTLPVGLYLQTDDRRLIVLNQNGQGNVFSFPGGTELFAFDLGLKDCTRAAYEEESGRICGITMDGICSVYDLNGKRLLNSVRFGDAEAAAAEEFQFSRLGVIEGEEVFSLYNLLSGKAVFKKNLYNSGKVRRIVPLFESELFAFGCLDGQVRVFDPTPENFPAVLSFGSKAAVTGLWYDERTSVLYGCNSAGAVRSWDLGLFREMTRIIPFAQLPGLNRIDEFVKKYQEPGVKAAAAWLKTVVSWRRRFDIELEFD